MSEQSRRRFLVAAGAGTVAAGAGTVLVPAPAAARPAPAEDDLPPGDAKVVAYVSDPAHDEVTLMVEDRERDVVTIELRAIAGVTFPLIDPEFAPDDAAGAVRDGTTPPGNDDAFPYLRTPHDGFAVPAA